MPTISIQATDTLFFRDGRPFSMSDDSFAQGIFPPPPSVLFGALRSARIAKGIEGGAEINELIPTTENLSFYALSLLSGSSHYFPIPLDLVVAKPKGNKRLIAQLLTLEPAPKYSNAFTSHVLRSSIDGKSEDEPLLFELTAFENYLNGEFENLVVRKRSDFITPESKIGIGRDRDSNIADGGKLFRIQANRLAKDLGKTVQKIGFLLGYEGLELPERGWLSFGGERRVAFFEKTDSFETPCPNIDNSRFKIYLSTPALFADGWKPTELLKQYGLTLLAAALDRPVHIGGWDLEKTKPKPMLQCVPAGSVYYVEAKDANAAKTAATAIHGKSISENLNQTNYKAQGFGIAYVGKI